MASAEGSDGTRGTGAVPTVSVVVPVRDAPERIGACIGALLGQSYPRDRIEILIVDNGSQDSTREVIGRYPVRLLVADRVASPYLARNTGIAGASGEIVALTDANCVPAGDWVERGVRALVESGADLVGGRVVFTLSERPSIGELADAVINVDVRASIRNHRACMTGNLFARRSVFERVGMFEERVRSGGDMRWTRRATDAGFRLAYADDARVAYPARPLAPLLRKQYRVGRGVPGVWASFGMSRLQMAGNLLRGLLPTPPGRLAALRRERGVPELPRARVRLWLAVWLCKVVRGAGCAAGLRGQASG